MAFSFTLLSALMAAGDPVGLGQPGSPSRPQPLTVDGKSRSVEAAELALRVETEAYDGASQRWVYGKKPSLVLSLEIRVDESSGRDGALAPYLYLGLPASVPAGLNGAVLDESSCSVEAWWGTEAPALQENRLELLSPLRAGLVTVRWTARTEAGQELSFEGQAEFVGLSVKVKNVGDVDGLLRKAWTALDLESLELVGETELEYGDEPDDDDEGDEDEDAGSAARSPSSTLEADRQHWMELHYEFK